MLPTGDDEADFDEAIVGLEKGDFSRLEPLFISDPGQFSRIMQWHKIGRFHDQTKALTEALTCACFLGRTDTAAYLLRHGIDPSQGAGTGMNAFHWAVNRGQLEAVRLLIRWKAPFDSRSMYGGNILDTAIWSAINEPRPEHLAVIEELLKAGARLGDGPNLTGTEKIDALLRQYGAA
jgi:Ankyrin repeats (3 copies)